MGTLIFGIIVVYLIIMTFVAEALDFLIPLFIFLFYISALWFLGKSLDLRYGQKNIRYLLPTLLTLLLAGYLKYNGTTFQDLKYLFKN